MNRSVVITALAAATLVSAGCSGESAPDRSEGPNAQDGAEVVADRCIVVLHGKGGTGTATFLRDDGIAEVAPSGNGEGWDALEWRYSSDDELDEAIAIVDAAIDAAGCERVVVHGFSNGASFAARSLCVGETFDGRLVGVVVDDPAPDTAAQNCRRPDDVPVALYWTGDLDDVAVPGTVCDDIDWTCRDDIVVGIETFAADLGTDIIASPLSVHERHERAPEPSDWLDAS